MRLHRFASSLLLLVTAACGPGGDAGDDDGSSTQIDAAPAQIDATVIDAPVAPFVPSNGAVVGGLEPTGLIVGAGGTFDTDIGCVPSAAIGRCAPVGDLCVCRADVLTLGDLDVEGTRALVILAWTSIDVTGDVTLVAGPGEDGPGGEADPGQAATSLNGAFGGSYGTRGADSADPPWGTAELVPLRGGRGGQDACGNRPGGGAGGAIQLSAGERITIAGGVNAGGGGGAGGSYGTCAGGAGGGSGGAILIEAPAVVLDGELMANGGGGGGGGGDGAGAAGQSGRIDGVAAQGGGGASGHGCPLYGYTSGGWGGAGGAGSTAPASGGPSDSVSGCTGGTAWLGEGGSGGGQGRIRINTRSGCQCLGAASPAPTRGTL